MSATVHLENGGDVTIAAGPKRDGRRLWRLEAHAAEPCTAVVPSVVLLLTAGELEQLARHLLEFLPSPPP